MGLELYPVYLFDPKELDISTIIREIGPNIIIKPIDQGSSVDLHVISGEDMLAETLERISVGHWIIEKRIFGRELTVGILGNNVLGLVEIIPREVFMIIKENILQVRQSIDFQR